MFQAYEKIAAQANQRPNPDHGLRNNGTYELRSVETQTPRCLPNSVCLNSSTSGVPRSQNSIRKGETNLDRPITLKGNASRRTRHHLISFTSLGQYTTLLLLCFIAIYVAALLHCPNWSFPSLPREKTDLRSLGLSLIDDDSSARSEP